MLKNYFKIAVRSIIRHRVFSFINIIGLASGITCFIILTLLVVDEQGYDAFNKQADRIYRVYVSSDINGNASNSSKTAGPLGETLKSEFPEVQNYSRLGYFGQYDLKYDDKLFREWEIYAADSTYFELFSLPLVYGDPKTALVDPRSIVLTERTAHKYFGDQNPMGKQFIVDDTTTFLITGVMKDFPQKSHFSCNFLISMSTYPESKSQNWIDAKYTTYVLFKYKINPRDVEKKLVRMVDEKVAPQAEAAFGINIRNFFAKGNRYGLFLQPLTSIHLYSQSHYGIELNTEWGSVRIGSIYYSYLFIAIGSFILLIAIFNFMNLTTAKSDGRAKEVGIRKTLGSDKTSIMWQFLVESTVTCLCAVFVAYGLVQLLLPVFNNFVGKQLALDLFDNFYTIPLLLVFMLVVGILSGSYPAFYLSSFQPSHILKPKSGKRKRSFRSALVIIQFTISIALIISTLIVKNQVHYILTKDLGFEKEHMIVINNASALGKRVESFKQELSSLPEVISSTNSSVMFQSGIPGSSFRIENAPATEFITCQFLDVDNDFVNTYNVQVEKGRYFSKEFVTDSSAVVMNESAARIFKVDQPVGKLLYKVNIHSKGDQAYRIVGVIKDFHYESLHQRIRPLILHLSPVQQAGSIFSIRIRANNFSSSIQAIKEKWQNFTNGRNINCTLLNDKLEKMYGTEIRLETVTAVFSSLAIGIACLGLFGLAAFITEKRIKEIGIRKVLGASMMEIIILLTKEFTRWVALANIIAWPIAYSLMNAWLQEFAYRIEINLWMFILAGSIAMVIALVTVGYHTIKAAVSNPIDALRYE
jgi:putative ABC transport system permease protein